MANFCPECGKALNEGAKFCDGCGNLITKAQTQTAEPRAFSITITRDGFWLGKTVLYIDDEQVGQLANKETITRKLSSGAHNLTVTCGGRWSYPIEMNGNKKYLLKMHRAVGGLFFENVS